MIRRRLLSQLMLFSALATAAAILLFGFYVTHVQHDLEERALGDEVQVVADDVSNEITQALTIGNYALIPPVLRQAGSNPGVLLLQVATVDGRLIGELRREHAGATPSVAAPDGLVAIPERKEPRILGDQEAVDVWRPVQGEHLLGWVHVVHDLSESRLLQSHLLQDSFLIGILVLPVSALLLLTMLRKPVSILRQAADFAAELPKAHGAQLPAESSSVEIHTLITALNTASTQLHEQDRALDGVRRQQERRSAIYEAMAFAYPTGEILAMIGKALEQDMPGALVGIMVKDKSGKRLTHALAPALPEFYLEAVDGLPIADEVGSCGTAAWRGERVVVGDVQHDHFWRNHRDLAARADIGACWSEPIRDKRGKVLGTLAIYWHEPASPNAEQLQLISQVANLVTLVLRRQHSEEALLLASSVYQASGEAIVVTDENNAIIAVNPAFTRMTGYTQDEVIGKNPSILASGRMDAAFYRALWRSLKTTGQWQGEIWNKRKDGEIYAEWLTINAVRDDHGHAYRHVAIFSDISDKKRAEETIWQQANYDQLTGLPNRRLFRDRLEQELRRAERSGDMLALLFVDLDRFKNVNDTMGHHAGDQVLIQAARRLEDCVRDSDTAARLSSDEFAVALTQVPDAGVVDRIAQSLLLRLAEPYELDEGPAYLSASIGITLFPSDGGDAETLLLNSSRAMNAAKHSGANTFSWYTLELQMAAKVRGDLGRDLRAALAENQFRVYYQPIVDLTTGRIVKAEALMRWQHPERGLVGPGTFIPLAEDLGLIGEMGDWVFRAVARQAKEWLDRGIELQYSVNKSPRQFGATDNQDAWLAYLEEIGLPSRCLVVEITEGLLLDARPDVIEQLAQLRQAGIQIAIDDFGTGYSALSYLQQFDIDYLKIDRSFIKDLGEDAADQALADAIVVMAHKLGIRVIAEGVETASQRDWLRDAHCDYAQGYLYAKPLPPEDFERLLESHNAPVTAAA